MTGVRQAQRVSGLGQRERAKLSQKRQTGYSHEVSPKAAKFEAVPALQSIRCTRSQIRFRYSLFAGLGVRAFRNSETMRSAVLSIWWAL